MRKILRYIVVLPIALILLALAVANRQAVGLHLDPFAGPDDAPFVELPLFLLIIGVLVLGLALGGIFVWIAQGKHRRAARAAQREAERLRQEAARMAAAPPARVHP